MMIIRIFTAGVCLFAASGVQAQDLTAAARARAADLRLASYATSRTVERLATDEAVRGQAMVTVNRMGITKMYIEVYRSGHVVSNDHLETVRDFFEGHDIEVVGGIATTPGGDVGVRQEGPLGWFNWQNEKTQRDIAEILRTVAPLFDTFIVDDFFCTGDVSDESKAAKGDRSWGEYRRELMIDVARNVVIGPMKGANPDISLILKYPQWYDRFHLFGYDTAVLPDLFDVIWVGTETRGARTQRFGYTQPYEGFVNYRWLAGIAGDKIGGAWFDHGDCAEHDFIDQAYMSVLAGAPELVFFNFSNVMDGHPDHDKIIDQFDQLAELAKLVRRFPVKGVPAYKPVNSEPYGDMYLFDFLGMLGIPLVPTHEVSADMDFVLLPGQAASDRDVAGRLRANPIVMTTNFVVETNEKWQSGEGPKRSGEKGSVVSFFDGRPGFLEAPVAVATELGVADDRAHVLLPNGKRAALVTEYESTDNWPDLIYLNTHTYDQSDFDAVGEVLLSPRPLGLLELEGSALNDVRAAFHAPNAPTFEGPTRVTMHVLDNWDIVLQNFNEDPVKIRLTLPHAFGNQFIDGFSETKYETNDQSVVSVLIEARDRVWLRRGHFESQNEL